MSRRVQIIGYYGMGNFGDELFRAVVAKRADEWWPGARVRAFALRRPSLVSRPGRLGGALRLGAAAAGLAWADRFALCGGSTLTGVAGVQALRVRLLGDRPIDALGVSVGPFASDADRQQVCALLDRADRIVVRDAASAERLGGDVTVGGDLAALAPLPARRPDADAITVCPSAPSGVPPERWAAQLIAALPPCSRVRVLALNHHPTWGDVAASRRTGAALAAAGHEVLVLAWHDLGLAGTCAALADSAAVWTQRLHGGLVAYLTGTPFVLVGHHAKCADFGADIGLHPSLLVAPTDDWADAARLSLTAPEPWEVSPEAYRRRAEQSYPGGPA